MILVCIGTRPEYLKIKPLLKSFEQEGLEYSTLFTGQHKDLLKNVKFDYEINIPKNVEINRLNNLFSSIITLCEPIIQSVNPDFVLVQGDTTTAAAIAMSTFHIGKKVVHLEAGLRTYDNYNPFPEEVNRQVISRISSIHLCPTEKNRQNLINERVQGDIFVTGNTSLDNIKDKSTSSEKKVIVTLHRRENHEDIDKWFTEVESLANEFNDYEFILPIHPNPNVIKHSHILKKVKVTEPLTHDEMINLISECKMVITDSGGIQEESSFLKKITIICRKTTERIESLEQSGYLCRFPEELKTMFKSLLNKKVTSECPYGDGNSSERITKIFKTYERI